MIVIRLGSTWTCRNRIGSVQRATAPKPTNRIRLEKVGIPIFALQERSLRELLHEDFGIAAALIVSLTARRRQHVWSPFDEAALGLKIRERLCRERQQLAQPQFSRSVFHELGELAADALVLMRGADVQGRQLSLLLLGIHMQGDAGDGILVNLEDEVVVKTLLNHAL